MEKPGLDAVQVARQNGMWDKKPPSSIPLEMPPGFKKALNQHTTAAENFNNMAPSYQRQFIGWIATAKKEVTQNKRISESISLLNKGKKLGMK